MLGQLKPPISKLALLKKVFHYDAGDCPLAWI